LPPDKRHISHQRRRENSRQQAVVIKAPVVPFAGPRWLLQAGREKLLQRRHPWIFSGAVERIEGNPASGETVQVCDTQGGFLTWAAYNSQSKICARVWSWLLAKIIALLVYIGAGLVALRFGRTKRIRLIAWLFGLLVFLYIVSVAMSKSVLGWFAFL